MQKQHVTIIVILKQIEFSVQPLQASQTLYLSIDICISIVMGIILLRRWQLSKVSIEHLPHQPSSQLSAPLFNQVQEDAGTRNNFQSHVRVSVSVSVSASSAENPDSVNFCFDRPKNCFVSNFFGSSFGFRGLESETNFFCDQTLMQEVHILFTLVVVLALLPLVLHSDRSAKINLSTIVLFS